VAGGAGQALSPGGEPQGEGDGLLLASAQVAIGLAITALATRLASGLLFEVRPLDLATLLSAVLLLTACTCSSGSPSRSSAASAC
jgi:hypothetical protein